MVQCGVHAVIKYIPAGIPQLSDPSRRYSRNIYTHTRGKPADSAGLPPSPSPCTPLVWVKESWADKKRHLWAVYGGFAWNQFRMSAKVDRLQRRVCVGDAAYDRMTFDTCYNFFSVATCRVHCCLRNVWMYRCSWPAGKYRRLHLQDRFASSDATVHRLRVAFLCKRHRSLRRFQNSLNKSMLLCAFSSFSAFKSAFEPDMTMCYARMHLNHCSLKLLKLTRFV